MFATLDVFLCAMDGSANCDVDYLSVFSLVHRACSQWSDCHGQSSYASVTIHPKVAIQANDTNLGTSLGQPYGL